MVPDLEEILVPIRALRSLAGVFLPMVVWAPAGTARTVMEAVRPERGSLLDDLPEAFAEMLSWVGPPRWFAVAVDSYATTDPDLRGASLAEAFRGGHPHVVEQLVLAVAEVGGVSVFRQVYRCTATDGWEWDPVEPAPRDGDLAAVMALIRPTGG